ncbi:alpha/beta fold hydrolase [Prosthecomicrobium sp. N25]|uniref:alpha/beta fold hydrolase n=1 Tax=Prosthecomicrobium sp. N25 TaxID=3129254 RepID=UPI0030781AFE
MSLPDLFSGFETRSMPVGDVAIHCRVGGLAGAAPLVLLHGYPQTHAMWHRLAGPLAERFRVVVPDLRGYGGSSVPEDRPGHAAYTKRAMAEDIVRLMADLGHDRFSLVGHDRGARVGYRLALDHPGRLDRLALLDIVPTAEMWSGMDARLALKVYHWLFLAQPAPMPEQLIGGAPIPYLEHTLASWTKAKNLSAFDPAALDHYRASYADPRRRHATCEDYRAGAGPDRTHDEADRAAGRLIGVPTLVLWGAAGIPAGDPDVETGSPLATWRRWCRQVEGQPIDAGHFLPEENPAATLAALLPFLSR